MDGGAAGSITHQKVTDGMGLPTFSLFGADPARSLGLDLKHSLESTAADLNGRATKSAAFAEDQATIGNGTVTGGVRASSKLAQNGFAPRIARRGGGRQPENCSAAG
jgi:hypothetical protein